MEIDAKTKKALQDAQKQSLESFRKERMRLVAQIRNICVVLLLLELIILFVELKPLLL